MSRRLVARRYAKALLQIGTRQGTLPEIQQELRSLRELVLGHGDLLRLVEHGLISPSRKAEAFDAVLAAAGSSQLLRDFFRVVTRSARLDHLLDIVEAFDTLVDEQLGIREALVTSAHPLSEPQQQALLEALSSRTGYRILARWTLDPSLLGGLRLQVGSTVYDASTLGRLHQLKTRMLAAPSL